MFQFKINRSSFRHSQLNASVRKGKHTIRIPANYFVWWLKFNFYTKTVCGIRVKLETSTFMFTEENILAHVVTTFKQVYLRQRQECHFNFAQQDPSHLPTLTELVLLVGGRPTKIYESCTTNYCSKQLGSATANHKS